MSIAAGIDVGGRKKGFHAVVLQDGEYLDKLRAADPEQMAAWIRRMGALAVAVDAPCRWRAGKDMRPAERALAAMRIHCFATPTLESGRSHPFYAWMRNGMTLYEQLAAGYPLLDGRKRAGSRVCFETFPHAAACLLAGRPLSARAKRADRRELLEAEGIDPGVLGSLDFVDAGLCALVAALYLRRKTRTLGDPAEGCIVLPA